MRLQAQSMKSSPLVTCCIAWTRTPTSDVSELAHKKKEKKKVRSRSGPCYMFWAGVSTTRRCWQHLQACGETSCQHTGSRSGYTWCWQTGSRRTRYQSKSIRRRLWKFTRTETIPATSDRSPVHFLYAEKVTVTKTPEKDVTSSVYRIIQQIYCSSLNLRYTHTHTLLVNKILKKGKNKISPVLLLHKTCDGA